MILRLRPASVRPCATLEVPREARVSIGRARISMASSQLTPCRQRCARQSRDRCRTGRAPSHSIPRAGKRPIRSRPLQHRPTGSRTARDQQSMTAQRFPAAATRRPETHRRRPEHVSRCARRRAGGTRTLSNADLERVGLWRRGWDAFRTFVRAVLERVRGLMKVA